MNVIKLYEELKELCNIEVTFSLGLNKNLSVTCLNFINFYVGSTKCTDLLGETYLQLIVWDENIPLNIFKQSAESYEPEKEVCDLSAFLCNTLIYYKYKHKNL